MNDLTLPGLLLVAGVLAHFLKTVYQLRRDGDKTSLSGYWRGHPYQSALTLVSALASFAILKELGQLSAITAFSAGYIANSTADMLAGRSVKLMS